MTHRYVLVVALAGCAPGPISASHDPREPLRRASVFANLDFEDVDAIGRPVGWRCASRDEHGVETEFACRTTTVDPVHGKRALVLPRHSYALLGSRTFDAARGLRFDAFVQGGVVYPTDLMALALTDQQPNDFAYVDGGDATRGWRKMSSVGAVPTNGDNQVALDLTNSSDSELRIDDVIAVQDIAQPAPKHGVLLLGDHYERLSYAKGKGPASLYTPLPLDYATQVPLDVELEVTPKSVVERIEYVADGEHDWGAVVHFVPTAHSDVVTLAWKAVVLTRDASSDERAALYAAKDDPARWLPATPVADSAYAPLVAEAKKRVAGSASSADKLRATIELVSTHIDAARPAPEGADATSVWGAAASDCTGAANFTDATARALGVPARHVTNIVAGIAQQTHSMSELYLGEALGWRRVEPQRAEPSVVDTRYLVMRVVLPTDEDASALRARAPWAAAGTPLHAFTESFEGSDRFGRLDSGDHFANCGIPGACLNRADWQGDLRGTDAQIKATFDQARAAWAIDRAALLAGHAITARSELRRKLGVARSRTDVDAVLAALPR